MKTISLIAAIPILLVGLAGCATSDSTDTSRETQTTTAPMDDKASVDRVVYFEFDSSALGRSGRDVIDAHTQYLVANADVTVFLQGHADERGTDEYNEALGERRAQTVARVLRAMGVNGKRIHVVSFGEKLPASNGHNEDAWAKNRRVEIAFRQ